MILACQVDETGGNAEIAAAEALLTAARGPGRWVVDDWKEAARTFEPRVPVDERVVALVRLPIGVTPMYEVSTVLDQHLGPDLVFRTDTGIQGWAVLSRPTPTERASE